MKILIILLILFSNSFFFVNAQNIIKIQGKVIDFQTKKSLPDATIILSKQQKVTTSNKKGEFSINSKFQNQILSVSYIGYQKYILNLDNLKNDTLLYISLKQKDVKIQKVLINPRKPTEIITNSLLQIPENYSSQAMLFTAILTETITENDTIIQQIEAVVEIYKAPYNTKVRDEMKFVEAKVIIDVQESELWDYIYFVNAPYELLYCDIAKYPKNFISIPVINVSFINEKYYKHYSYTIRQTKNNKYFIIDFVPNSETRRGVFEGTIMIEKKTYAICSLKYKYSDSRMKRINNHQSRTEIELGKIGVGIPDISYYSEVNYQKHKNIWILKSAKNEYSFLFQIGKNKPSIINVRDELQIINIKTENVEKIKFWDRIIRDVKLIDQVRSFK